VTRQFIVGGERKRPISDITVSVGSRRLAGLDTTALVAGVSVPLPIFDRKSRRDRGTVVGTARRGARLTSVRLEVRETGQSASPRRGLQIGA